MGLPEPMSNQPCHTPLLSADGRWLFLSLLLPEGLIHNTAATAPFAARFPSQLGSDLKHFLNCGFPKLLFLDHTDPRLHMLENPVSASCHAKPDWMLL